MKVNFKLRFKNKLVLAALLTAVVTFVYDVLSVLGIAPTVPQVQVMEWLEMALALLVTLGVITDPTTEGISDSDEAMAYDEPKK